MGQIKKILSAVKEFITRNGIDKTLRMLEIYAPNDSEMFLKRLYVELSDIVKDIEESAPLRLNDKEDRITIDIVHLLRRTGYNASHDPFTRGHVDIRVEKNSFIWLGEAKMHDNSGYDWLLDGLKQLHTRYSTGREDGSGLLIYIKQKNAKAVIDEWRRRLETGKNCNLKEAKDGDEKLTFWTVHEHTGSGLEIETKHIGVSLYYHPERSNRTNQ